MKSLIVAHQRACNVRIMRRFASAGKENGASVLIFGSSTGVGKTIVSAGLSIAALRAERKVCYIKPVQTGDMDQYFVKLYTNPEGVKDIHFRTLRLWIAGYSGPVDQSIGPDKDIVDEVIQEIQNFESESPSSRAGEKEPFSVVETAGGVLSPGPNQSLQADMFKPLQLPVVLVGDAGLGGISGTLCALEALQRRGYSVRALVFIDKPYSEVLKNTFHVQHQLLNGFLDSAVSTTTNSDTDTHTNTDVNRSNDSNNANKSTMNTSTSTNTNASTSISTVLPTIINLAPLPQNSSHLLGGWFKANENGFASLFQALQPSVVH